MKIALKKGDDNHQEIRRSLVVSPKCLGMISGIELKKILHAVLRISNS
jgi:hypothetical protein